jgi:2-keto-4-pentenoate hydratase/2-oxohepta-3-ene-1,7-dioic acid hydratase in catechol pathway
MHYTTFSRPDGVTTWGIEREGRVYDLGPSGLDLAASLKDAIVDGVFGVVEPAQLERAESFDEAEIQYLPPIPDPGKIFCIGVNYHEHRVEGGRPEAKAPTVFVRFSDSQMGHKQAALRPFNGELYDYEGEMALVIKKGGYRISAEDAWDHIAGYGAYNDFSVRDWQRAASQWAPGKNFPASGGFGPWLVPQSDIEDVTKLRLQTRVNGEVRQDAHVDQLIFDIPSLIEHLSGFTPLSPGDVVVTGTPGGVGVFMEPSGLLHEGDVVEVEITGLGTLENTVVQERQGD